jgi:hypothetical protein
MLTADAGGMKRRQQIEVAKLPHGVRLQRDAYAKLPQLRDLFVNLALNPVFVQEERAGEAANAGPDNDRLHESVCPA